MKTSQLIMYHLMRLKWKTHIINYFSISSITFLITDFMYSKPFFFSVVINLVFLQLSPVLSYKILRNKYRIIQFLLF